MFHWNALPVLLVIKTWLVYLHIDSHSLSCLLTVLFAVTLHMTCHSALKYATILTQGSYNFACGSGKLFDCGSLAYGPLHAIRLLSMEVAEFSLWFYWKSNHNVVTCIRSKCWLIFRLNVWGKLHLKWHTNTQCSWKGSAWINLLNWTFFWQLAINACNWLMILKLCIIWYYNWLCWAIV